MGMRDLGIRAIALVIAIGVSTAFSPKCYAQEAKKEEADGGAQDKAKAKEKADLEEQLRKAKTTEESNAKEISRLKAELKRLEGEKGTQDTAKRRAGLEEQLRKAEAKAESDAKETRRLEGDVEGLGDLDEILVTGTREGSAADGYRYSEGELGPLGDVPLKDVPYSIHVTSGELIENLNAHNPTDALKTNPAVVPLMSSSGYSSMHRVMIRGFSASDQSDLRDGLVDRSFTLPPLEDVDRVEVMDGLTSFLYGFSSVGGTVNYITKKPLDERLIALRAGFYDSGISFAHADLGGPLYGDRLTGRLNLYGEDGDTYIDDATQKRGLVSGALRYRLFEETYLRTYFYYQDMRAKGLQTYFDIRSIGYEVPDAFDPTEQYGQKWTYNKASKGIIDLGIDSKLTDVFSLRAAVRGGKMDREYSFVGARLTDLVGNYTETYVNSSGNDESTMAAYALMDAGFDTWGIRHKLTFGYTNWDFTFERGINAVTVLGPSNIHSPVAYIMPWEARGYDRRMRMRNHNILVGDRIEFSPAWSALAGVTYARLEADYHGAYAVPPRPSHVGLGAYTPAFGLVFKPVPPVSLYASYMEGLEEGGTAPAYVANAYEVLNPSVSTQYETGVKATLWKKLDLSTAFFLIDKVNSLVDPIDNVYKQDGREVHQGIELMGSGRLWDCLNLVGGWTLMSAKINDAANNRAIEGETPVNVPERQARLYVEYDLPKFWKGPGVFTLTSGANYYGGRPVNIPNTEEIHSATTFDIGFRYQYKDNLKVNFGVTNLLDKHYWSYYRIGSDGVGEDGLLLGSPRLFSFAVKYSF